MALSRPVRMSDGTVLSWHEVTSIGHIVGTLTEVEVTSWPDQAKGDEGMAHVTRLSMPYEDGMTEAQAYELVGSDERFAEYVDPAQSALDELLPTLTDEQAELVPQAFSEWAVDVAYAEGDRVRYDGKLYRCVQAHEAIEGYEPPNTPALWVRTASEGEIPEWVQPTGAHDAYNEGDKVTHNGKTWESLIDANVWEPGAAGTENLWSEVVSS